MVLSSTAMSEISQTMCSTIAVSMGSLMMTRYVLLFLGQPPLNFLTTPDSFDQVSEETSGRVPWAEGTTKATTERCVN